jgi:hypothetical protein
LPSSAHEAGGQVDELLAACWEETLDAGPYDFGEKPIDWGVVLQGDRFFALLQIRALTYGPTYAFAVNARARPAARVSSGSWISPAATACAATPS